MIKNESKYGFLEWTVLVLFLVAPFVMSFQNEELADRLYARMLPSIVTDLADLIRWISFTFLAIFAIIKLQSRTVLFSITLPVWFLGGFYFIQLLYALIDGTDILRFSLLTVLSIFIPPSISYMLVKRPKNLQYFVYLILFFIVLSVLLNGHLIFSGIRFFGFMNNPNAYGISTVFWMVIILIAERNRVISRKVFLFVFILILITMLFSGSRNGMIGILFVVLLNYFTMAKRFASILLLSGLAVLLIAYLVDLSFVIERFLNIYDSFQDSGRTDIWQRAYYAIEQNIWWGNGMDANDRIANTGNMHNCYIRFVLNMGLLFTISAMLFYLGSIMSTLKYRKSIPLVLVAYLMSYAFMNIGEDLFVGIGSSAYIYILFIFGLINFYLVKTKLLLKIHEYNL